MHTQVLEKSGENALVDEGPILRVDGTVKWYDNDKGFGFVIPDDGGEDIFLGKDVVEQAKLGIPAEDSRVTVASGWRPKGRQAIVLYSLVVPPPPVREIRGPDRGLVKMFNDERGFGFISLGNGTPDIFFHVSLLRQIGRESVPSGAPVEISWGTGKKGLTATELQVLPGR